MFKFLKDKLKSAVDKFSKKVDEEGETEEQRENPVEKQVAEQTALEEPRQEPIPEPKKPETTKEEPKEDKETPAERLTGEQTSEPEEQLSIAVPEQTALEEQAPEAVLEPSPKEEHKQNPVPEPPEQPERKGFFGKLKEKVVTKKINESQFEDLFFELEMAMLENNVAVEVIEKIKEDLKSTIVNIPIKRTKISLAILNTLQESISTILQKKGVDVLQAIKEHEGPYIIAFVGVNGSGKTTSIAKLTKYFLDNNLKVVLAAADTFRAAAIDQLQHHADALGVKMIKHDYGSDPAAVAYDAIEHAKAKQADVVLIDTAGRLHSSNNLVDEMKKIIRIAKPDLKIFVGEALTGNDCVEQAKQFNEAIEIDGIILSKADVDEKGGAFLSVSYVTGKPILYVGIGQEYQDIKPFDKELIMQHLGLA